MSPEARLRGSAATVDSESLLTENIECDDPHLLGIVHRGRLVIFRDVVPARVRRVVLTVRRKALERD